MVRTHIKSKGMNTGSKITETEILNDLIKEVLDKAIARAQANKRKTVLPRDL
jgi:histone H3/H4